MSGKEDLSGSEYSLEEYRRLISRRGGTGGGGLPDGAMITEDNDVMVTEDGEIMVVE